MREAIARTLRIAVPRISVIPKKSAANPFADLKVMQAAWAHQRKWGENTSESPNGWEPRNSKGKSSSSFLEFLSFWGVLYFNGMTKTDGIGGTCENYGESKIYCNQVRDLKKVYHVFS